MAGTAEAFAFYSPTSIVRKRDVVVKREGRAALLLFAFGNSAKTRD